VVILLVIGAIALCGGVLWMFGRRDSYSADLGIVVFWVAMAFFLIAVVCIPANRARWRGDLVAMEAVQRTIDDARANGELSPFEIAAIQQEAARWNAALAVGQYWAKSPFFGVYHPRDITDAQPIR